MKTTHPADARHAEASLVASELRYRRLFETAKDGILILDAETGMVVDVNPFLIKLLHWHGGQAFGGFFKIIVQNVHALGRAGSLTAAIFCGVAAFAAVTGIAGIARFATATAPFGASAFLAVLAILPVLAILTVLAILPVLAVLAILAVLTILRTPRSLGPVP